MKSIEFCFSRSFCLLFFEMFERFRSCFFAKASTFFLSIAFVCVRLFRFVRFLTRLRRERFEDRWRKKEESYERCGGVRLNFLPYFFDFAQNISSIGWIHNMDMVLQRWSI